VPLGPGCAISKNSNKRTGSKKFLASWSRMNRNVLIILDGWDEMPDREDICQIDNSGFFLDTAAVRNGQRGPVLKILITSRSRLF